MNMRSLLVVLSLITCAAFGEGFGEQTLVRTPFGKKQIQNLKMDDWVCAVNSNGKQVFRRITNLHQNDNSSAIKLSIGNESFICSLQQRFLTANKEWVEAKDIKAGTPLYANNGKHVHVDNVEQFKQAVKTYTMTVDQDHNYQVGDVAITAHNEAITGTAWIIGFIAICAYKVVKDIIKKSM